MATDRKSIELSPAGYVFILSALALGLLGLQGRFRQPPTTAATVLITEFCAHNGNGLLDHDGHHSDWIELYNAGTRPVELEGWHLTDNFHNLTKWRFPKADLDAGKYLVVFASGKDRHQPGAEMHTNFKLKDGGEYLALVMPDGVTIGQDFFPKYPRQINDISYGLTAEAIKSGGAFRAAPHAHRYFQLPTPGQPNAAELLGLVKNVHFSRRSGFYDAPFELRLSCATPRAGIYYTLDGSTPAPTNGTRYARSIPIRSTMVVRAIAVAPGMAASELECQTYLFLEDVPKQTGEHLPGTWGKQDDWTAPAHYTLSAEIASDPGYHARLKEGLLSIPSLSIVTDSKNLFDPQTGIYTHTMTNGVAWERPASVEMLNPDDGTLFRINCGLRIQGGWNRRPLECPKHSLRLLFKKEYGPSKLSFPLFGHNAAVEFDTLILRGGNNNSWLHWNAEERRRGDYLRDEWMRRTLLAMGYPSARGRFVHVYLNGLYWGLYNLCERPSAPFVAANEGGSKEDYDSMKAMKILSGDKNAWSKLMAVANAGLAQEDHYRAFQELVDLPELTDYLILNFYGGNADWDRSSNWYAARRRKPAGKFQFFVWDGERTLEGVDVNSMAFDDDESPPRLFHKLSENEEYRLFFADRVQRLLFDDGPLTPELATKRYQVLATGIEKAVVAESARWGNYRRDLHPYKVGPYEFYKPDVHWKPEVTRLLTQYFAQRPVVAVYLPVRSATTNPSCALPGRRLKRGRR
ncbi:MAG: CotH kinase family protein [Verrucomicrobia bacterium]|nr:CotH kinase family protein [Verrucomicrobiota bacterium]